MIVSCWELFVPLFRLKVFLNFWSLEDAWTSTESVMVVWHRHNVLTKYDLWEDWNSHVFPSRFIAEMFGLILQHIWFMIDHHFIPSYTVFQLKSVSLVECSWHNRGSKLSTKNEDNLLWFRVFAKVWIAHKRNKTKKNINKLTWVHGGCWGLDIAKVCSRSHVAGPFSSQPEMLRRLQFI